MTQHEKDIQAIKECLIGTEFNRKGCVLDRLDKIDSRIHETDKKVCITQNQVNTLMQDLQKRQAEEQAKAASKLAFRKFLSSLTLGLIKMKTGI